MLNSDGKAGIGVLVVLLILMGVGSGAWYVANDGWSGTPAGTLNKLKTMVSGEGRVQEQSVIPPVTSKPEASSSGTHAVPPGLPGSQVEASPYTGTPATPEGEQAATNPTPGAGGQPGTAPAAVLKSCIDKLKQDDIIGAEQFVSDEGMKYTVGGTTGVHEVLWKGLYRLHAYDGLDYDRAKTTGQTAWIPVYTDLGSSRMVVAYAVMANRGAGWKLDHLCDERKY